MTFGHLIILEVRDVLHLQIERRLMRSADLFALVQQDDAGANRERIGAALLQWVEDVF